MIAAFTGHRPDKLDDILGTVGGSITELLKKLSPERVISGMAPGIDLLGLRMARRLEIPVTAAIPWIGHPFSKAWDYGQRIDMYRDLLDECDVHEVICEGEQYQPWFYQKRNEWMVDNCDVLIAVWNGSDGGTKNCVKYAQKVGRPIWYYNWNDGTWIYEYLPV